MLIKYVEENKKILKKYSYSYYSIDYKNMLEEIIENINIHLSKLNEQDKKIYTNQVLTILFDYVYKQDKKVIKKYINLLKKYKIYKYELNKKNQFFMKHFFKLYINIYMIKNKKYMYFRKLLIPTMPNKIKKQVKIFLEKKDSNVFGKIKTLLPNKLYVDYLELVITTKCTLRCKNCANLMHLYKRPYDVENEKIIKSIKKLEECVDEIYLFRILGGEPFCNSNLKYYLKEIPTKKFKKTVIVTNGTLIPKDIELLNIIKEKNIIIEISNYGKYSKKIEELVELLQKEKINYQIVDTGRLWYDYGKVENKNRDKKSLKKQFINCNTHCKSLLNGKIYYCPRHAHGIDLNKIERKTGEYVDLINNSVKENKKQLKKLMLRNNYVEACKYCDYATPDCKVVPAAEQCQKK